jgi:hypothetical protein
MKMKKQDIVVAGAQLGASVYVLVNWQSKRAISAAWLLKLSRHLARPVEEIENVWSEATR